MAYTRSKTGPHQVAPDAILWRRFGGARYSIGEPPERAARTWPLHATTEGPGVFDQVALRYWPPDHHLPGATKAQSTDPPALQWDKPIWGQHAGSLKGVPAKGATRTILLTETDKMGCPSWSLPAGPLYEGGTCVMAGKDATGRQKWTPPGAANICDDCYALKNRYSFLEASTSQAARLAWVTHHLVADPSGASLAHDLVTAIADYARLTTLRWDKGATTDRRTMLLGTWHNDKMHIPGWLFGIVHVPALPYRLSPGLNTDDPFRVMKADEGEVVGYFRLHDAGDVTVGPNPASWRSYLAAWDAVMSALPRVLFWMPTRAWVLPPVRRILVEMQARHANLVIRPSSLNMNDPPPAVPGLAAGTAVVLRDQQERWMSEAPGTGKVRPCPATMTVGDIGPKYTCRNANCLACWLEPGIPVAYKQH